jgi:hypothetical protein
VCGCVCVCVCVWVCVCVLCVWFIVTGMLQERYFNVIKLYVVPSM